MKFIAVNNKDIAWNNVIFLIIYKKVAGITWAVANLECLVTMDEVVIYTEALKLLENLSPLMFRNARSAVPDFNPDVVAFRPRADQNAARGGIADGVADQVLEDAAQICRVAFNHRA